MSTSFPPNRTATYLLLAALASILATPSRAQSQTPITQTYNGGTSNTWDAGSTADWSGANGTTWVGGLDEAIFNSAAGGTVTASDANGSITFEYLAFSNGAWTINSSNGDPITKYAYTQSLASASNIVTETGASGNVIINTPIQLESDDAGDGGNMYILDTSTSGSLTFNGAFTFVHGLSSSTYGTDTPGQNITIFTDSLNAADIVTYNNTIKGSTLALGRNNYANGNYVLGTSADLTNSTLELFSGTLITKTAKLGSNPIQINYWTSGGATTLTETRAFLTAGNLTITNNFSTNVVKNVTPHTIGTFTLGTSDNGTSIYSGNIALGDDDAILTAAAGGTATFSGQITGNAPGGLTKTGAGKVIISNPGTITTGGSKNTNSYTITNNTSLDGGVTVGTVAMDIQQGTLQIDNAGGSAFGATAAATVNVEAGATLSGVGISTQAVNVMAATSVLAPGDGVVGGVLKLYGGINAANGLTMNFTIDALGNGEAIDTKQGISVFGGTITLNFTSSAPDGSVLTNFAYNVLYATGGGNWTEAPGTTFTVNGPAGYTGTADFDPAGLLSVTFETVPEPSSWAMLLGGAGLLVVRLRRLQARA